MIVFLFGLLCGLLLIGVAAELFTRWLTRTTGSDWMSENGSRPER